MALPRFGLALACVALTLGMPFGAAARPAQYKCDGDTLEFKVDFTPRKAQLYLPEQTRAQTLTRIKSARDAHYLNYRAGLTIVAKKGDLTLLEGGRRHHCKLQIAS